MLENFLLWLSSPMHRLTPVPIFQVVVDDEFWAQRMRLWRGTSYGVEVGQFNETSFKPVTTSALRIEVQLQEGWFGGIHEWRVK